MHPKNQFVRECRKYRTNELVCAASVHLVSFQRLHLSLLWHGLTSEKTRKINWVGSLA